MELQINPKKLMFFPAILKLIVKFLYPNGKHSCIFSLFTGLRLASILKGVTRSPCYSYFNLEKAVTQLLFYVLLPTGPLVFL